MNEKIRWTAEKGGWYKLSTPTECYHLNNGDEFCLEVHALNGELIAQRIYHKDLGKFIADGEDSFIEHHKEELLSFPGLPKRQKKALEELLNR